MSDQTYSHEHTVVVDGVAQVITSEHIDTVDDKDHPGFTKRYEITVRNYEGHDVITLYVVADDIELVRL